MPARCRNDKAPELENMKIINHRLNPEDLCFNCHTGSEVKLILIFISGTSDIGMNGVACLFIVYYRNTRQVAQHCNFKILYVNVKEIKMYFCIGT